MRNNLPFENLDLEGGFKPRPGGVKGIYEKVLVNDLDVAGRKGKRTRLLKLDPGVQTPAAHDHPYWEELYVIRGSMVEGSPETGENEVVAPAYACRKPGFMHGPVRTDEGCLIIEFNWFDEDGA